MSSPSLCLTLPRPSSIPYYCFLCQILNPEEPIALKIARVSAVQAVQSVAAAEGRKERKGAKHEVSRTVGNGIA